jgi:hypothetical protein
MVDIATYIAYPSEENRLPTFDLARSAARRSALAYLRLPVASAVMLWASAVLFAVSAWRFASQIVARVFETRYMAKQLQLFCTV